MNIYAGRNLKNFKMLVNEKWLNHLNYCFSLTYHSFFFTLFFFLFLFPVYWYINDAGWSHQTDTQWRISVLPVQSCTSLTAVTTIQVALGWSIITWLKILGITGYGWVLFPVHFPNGTGIVNILRWLVLQNNP